MSNQVFAPVLIPTLNRYDHFHDCLESLCNCTGCEKTDVYVALDYPPSEKYVEGWKKIEAYLSEKEINNPFKSLNIYRRDHNYGLFSEKSNINVLLDDVSKNYDFMIISEDDNVFSPNFLVYINKGLYKYKDDPSVFAICGYTQPYVFKYDINNYFRHNTDFSAWGYGMWTSKFKRFKEWEENNGFQKSLSWNTLKEMHKHGLNRLYQYIRFCFHYKGDYMPITDCMITCYMIINNMQAIYPSVTKVRNMGWDNTGNSFENHPKKLKKYEEIANRHNFQMIDENNSFEYQGDEWSYYDYNNRLTAEVSEGRLTTWEFSYKIVSYFIKLLLKNLGVKSLLTKTK